MQIDDLALARERTCAKTLEGFAGQSVKSSPGQKGQVNVRRRPIDVRRTAALTSGIVETQSPGTISYVTLLKASERSGVIFSFSAKVARQAR